MKRVPPRIVRRLVLFPLALALSLALLAASPLLVGAGLVADLLLDRTRLRATRLVTFGLVYLVFEVVGLLAMPALWVAVGFRAGTPRSIDLHYRFLRWWLAGVYRAAGSLFRLRIRIEDPPPRRDGPVLVFSRHAGPGNSLMLVGTIMIEYRRRPRIVALAKLQWEPLFDIMGNRLPIRFIDHDPVRRERHVEAIGRLATGLGDRDALVLFPEGRDFTQRLRLRAIAHLRGRGREREARLAEGMRYVLPPKVGGVAAAVGAAPGADVVFVAHSVLEDVGPLRSLWRRIPFRDPVDGRYWRVPAAEVPRGREELARWLFDWWARIDGWIDRQVAAGEASERP